MTKKEIADKVAEDRGMSRVEAADLVEAVLDLMKEALTSGDELKIAGFGKWVVKEKGDRLGRNPQTGEELTIGQRKVLTFKPSPLLKDKINGTAPDSAPAAGPA